MPIHWTDGRSSNTLPRLIRSYLDSEVPFLAVKDILQLCDLLILSNHITKAHELVSAVYSLAAQYITYKHPSLVLELFWHTHRETITRPMNAILAKSGPPDIYLPREQWGKYRECTHTGWMLDNYGLAEPQDTSIWRETDDPVMLAMCARLLSKTLTPGTYPPQDTMREALAVAMKLYSLKSDDSAEYMRNSYLLYRRLPIELAIRVGETQIATDILSQALKLDGCVNGGSLQDFLLVWGIYDVLPLLAVGGKESNPFFITKEDADVIVPDIISAIELRAKEGRQWELAEDKVGWRELLDRLATAAWKVHYKEYWSMGVKSANDILYGPATEEEIEVAERMVGELPTDLKEMVRLANGFIGGTHFFGGGIAGIQYICKADENLDNFVCHFATQGMKQDGIIGGRMIEIEPGSENSDLFSHYIIPSTMWKQNVVGREVKDGEYQYWHWAPWEAVIHRWNSVRDYVASCVEEVEGMVERGEEADFDGEDDEEEEEEEDDANE